MNLRTRFNLLLVLLCLGLAASLLALRYYEKRETRLILHEIRQQRSHMLDRLIELSGRSLRTFTRDYSLWTEMADFVAKPAVDRAWTNINIDSSLTTFQAETAWVFKPDGRLFYTSVLANEPPVPITLLPPPDQLAERLKRDKVCHFFIKAGAEIYEIRGSVIVPSEDLNRSTPPRGYFLTARHWGAQHLAGLAELSQARIELADSYRSQTPAVEQSSIHLFRNLPDWQGMTASVLHLRYDSAEISLVSETDVWESVILFAFGSLAILLVVHFTYRWVLRPVGGISESLATGNLAPLERYYDERSELGRVANLVRSSFQDREKLRGTMQERAQLSRDLHDGLIQALYAIGMNLASIGPLLRRKPEQAETQLDQARSELNASIRELRSFITRLEPADAEKKDFGQAVRLLVEFMQTAHPTTFKLEMDDALASGLAVERSTQLLYIVREALSNALRHGRGDTVTLRLQPAGDLAVFSVHDNGRGFDPAAPRQGGHGLDNMTERALQLAGTLQISSLPGQGTLVTVRFPHSL